MTNSLKKSTIILYMMIALFLCRFFHLEFISSSDLMKKIYSTGSEAIFVWVIIWYITVSKGKFLWSEIKFLAAVLLLFLYAALVTYALSGSVYRLVSAYYPLIGLICFLNGTSRKHQKEVVAAFALLLYILVVLNFLDMILFKDLSEQYSTTFFLLGSRNHLAVVFAIGYAFVEIYASLFIRTRRGKLTFTGVYMLIVISSSVASKSATTLLAMGVMLIFRIFRANKIIDRLLNPVFCLSGYIAIWFGLVFLGIQELFSFLVTVVLNRNMSLSGRVQVWDIVISEIKESLFLGHGMQSTGNLFTTITPGSDISHVLSAHNQILQSLYEGGLISILLLILCYWAGCCGKGRGKVFYTFFCALITILVVCLTEAIDNTQILTGIAFCVFARQIDMSGVAPDACNS